MQDIAHAQHSLARLDMGSARFGVAGDAQLPCVEQVLVSLLEVFDAVCGAVLLVGHPDGLVAAGLDSGFDDVHGFPLSFLYVDIFSITDIADFATSRLLSKTGVRPPRIVSERQYACYTEYVHIEGDFQ